MAYPLFLYARHTLLLLWARALPFSSRMHIPRLFLGSVHVASIGLTLPLGISEAGYPTLPTSGLRGGARKGVPGPNPSQ